MVELPESIRDVQHLEDLLSEPTRGVVDVFRRLHGDVIILGAGGKMGVSLARMARRADQAASIERRIVAVSRFSDTSRLDMLEHAGIETIRCDLLDPEAVDRLPDCPNVIVMVGWKFGTHGNEPFTWAMNAYLPSLICRKFRKSRIVAFSTGNVYGLTPVSLGGSTEDDPLRPIGEYAFSCVGRERIYTYHSRELEIPMVLLRLNYAHELRYGVLVDIARKVQAGQPVDVTMGYFNALWQGDANAMALQSLELAATPPLVLNLAGPETVSVRRSAQFFSDQFGVEMQCTGVEADDAFLSNAQLSHRLFGYPRVPLRRMQEWIADWLARSMPVWEKPTHFENRLGEY